MWIWRSRPTPWLQLRSQSLTYKTFTCAEVDNKLCNNELWQRNRTKKPNWPKVNWRSCPLEGQVKGLLPKWNYSPGKEWKGPEKLQEQCVWEKFVAIRSPAYVMTCSYSLRAALNGSSVWWWLKCLLKAFPYARKRYQPFKKQRRITSHGCSMSPISWQLKRSDARFVLKIWNWLWQFAGTWKVNCCITPSMNIVTNVFISFIHFDTTLAIGESWCPTIQTERIPIVCLCSHSVWCQVQCSFLFMMSGIKTTSTHGPPVIWGSIIIKHSSKQTSSPTLPG